jgi:hypothetical protein
MIIMTPAKDARPVVHDAGGAPCGRTVGATWFSTDAEYWG